MDGGCIVVHHSVFAKDSVTAHYCGAQRTDTGSPLTALPHPLLAPGGARGTAPTTQRRALSTLIVWSQSSELTGEARRQMGERAAGVLLGLAGSLLIIATC